MRKAFCSLLVVLVFLFASCRNPANSGNNTNVGIGGGQMYLPNL